MVTGEVTNVRSTQSKDTEAVTAVEPQRAFACVGGGGGQPLQKLFRHARLTRGFLKNSYLA